MTPEEANAVVEDAIAKGLAKHGAGPRHEMRADECQHLALIYMSEVSDWTVQIAYLVGDHRWEQAKTALVSMRTAVDKLAGAVNHLTLPPK